MRSPSLQSRPLPSLLTLGLLLVGAGATAFAQELPQEPAPETDAQASVADESGERVTVLSIHRLRDEDEPTPESLAAEIAEVDPPRVDLLLDMLRSRVVPPIDERAPQALSVFQEALILDVFSRLQPVLVRLELERWNAAPEDEGRRAATLLTLGTIGNPRDLNVMVGLTAREEEQEIPSKVSTAFRRALAELITREAPTLEYLDVHWRRLPRDVVSLMVLAIGDSRKKEGLALLTDVLVWREDLALVAMTQVALLGPSPADPAAPVLADSLRPYLDPNRPEHCRAAALALGELEDFDSLEALIELLEDEARGIRENALWSLRRISGLSFGADARWWTHWLSKERAWTARERPDVLRRLSSPNSAQALDAIRILSHRRFRRHELVREMLPVLKSPDPVVRGSCCHALSLMGSPVAVESLVALLLDDEPEVATAAWEALRSITKLDLPQDILAWEATLPEREQSW